MLAKFISHIIFKISGWKVVGRFPKNVPKCVMIAAPHTSNWDFFYARCAFYIMEVDLRFTIKKEAINWPVVGSWIKYMGALPVDRSKNNSLVQAMVDIFNQNEKMVIMITPEGTRKYQPRWRRGFYHAALGAGVPISLGYLDYAKKEAGVGPMIYPTGDIEKDLEEILAFYRTKTGKFPENGVR